MFHWFFWHSIYFKAVLKIDLSVHLWLYWWRNMNNSKSVRKQTAFMSIFSSVQFSQCVQLFATPWIAARKASLSITNSRSSLKLMSIESVTPSSHLILCHPLLLLPPIPPSIRVFFQWVNCLHEVAKVLEFQV